MPGAGLQAIFIAAGVCSYQIHMCRHAHCHYDPQLSNNFRIFACEKCARRDYKSKVCMFESCRAHHLESIIAALAYGALY